MAEADRARLMFLVTAHALTDVQRLNRVLDGSRSETSAEHSWHLALSAVMLSEHAGPTVALERVVEMLSEHAGPTVALERVVEMLLVHDIVEVDVGDVPIYDTAERLAIAELEDQAADRLFGLLPEPQGSRYRDLWREFEEAETDDARFARALDRLQPILVHWAGGGTVWRERGTTVDDEHQLLAVIEQHWPPLLPLATAIIEDAVKRGMLVRSR
jgi:putative hydrolase of HD superfamily